MKLGAQFFTLRDYCKTLDDFSETLKKIADMGYSAVQISGTCAYEPEWLNEQLKKNGLDCSITHFDKNRILTDTENVIKAHDIFGCHCIGLGGSTKQPEDFKELVEALRAPSQMIYDAGHQFCYHHHAWEYEDKTPDGRTILEYLGDEFTPEQMNFTLDTYWVHFGGGDILSEINRLSGRLYAVHLKDMLITDDGEKRMQWVGGGNAGLDFVKIVDAFEKAGAKYAYVEQDNCYGEDPFEMLKKSYDYLTSIGMK